MHFAYKLNKQGDNIQLWCPPFPVLNQSVVPCLMLTVASWPTYRFLRRQLKWFSTHISLRMFHSLLWSTQSKGFSIVGEGDVLLEFPCCLYHPTNVGNLVSGSSASLKLSLYIWKFSAHILLKPDFANGLYVYDGSHFEHSSLLPLCLSLYLLFAQRLDIREMRKMKASSGLCWV